jgi:hypothetical protein
MPTIEFDGQFAPEPVAPVRERYDMVAILRRNVANLEIALKQQTERAKAAESELEAVREDNHAMMLEIDGMRTELAKPAQQKPVMKYMGRRLTPKDTMESWGIDCDVSVQPEIGTPLYAAPVPAPAVPLQWREVMAELAADLQAACDAEYPHRAQYQSVMRKYNNDMEIVEKARALLQSADHSELAIEKVAPDCRACANRGLVNGLSQESYCDGCVYQGRSWRKNHFVLAVKRRCEACAILPCSCK